MSIKVIQGFVGQGGRSNSAETSAAQKTDVASSVRQVTQTATRASQIGSEAVVTTIKSNYKGSFPSEKIKTDHEAKVIADRVARSITGDEGEDLEQSHALDYLGKSSSNKEFLLS